MGSIGAYRASGESGPAPTQKKQPARLDFLEDKAASDSLGAYAEKMYDIQGMDDLTDNDFDRIANEFDNYRQGFESFVNEYVNDPDNGVDRRNMSDADYRALRRRLAKMYDSRNNL